jgi:hypothetical protein
MSTAFHLTSRSLYADGRTFGPYGAYERLDGTLSYSVDPDDPANQMIVDLDLADVDSGGRVRFEGDVVILRPTDPSARSRVLVEATNRGRRLLPWIMNRASRPDPSDPVIPVGDGFLLRHGFAVVYLGWQWDVIRDGVLLGLTVPEARRGGDHVTGRAVVEVRPNAPERTCLLAHGSHRPLPVHDLDEADAVMTVRDWEGDRPRVVPRDRWAFVRATEQGYVPSREYVTLFDGFEPGRQYHVIYTAAEAPIVGCGLLALREAASLLRSDAESNPLAGKANRVYAFGISQAGRLLRHFVYLGLNRTLDGGKAFDGMITLGAGAQRGEFNQRFGQPSVQLTPGLGHQFPFADDELADPYGHNQRDGLLARQKEVGAVPRIIAINSSAEYWRGDGSLVHISPAGTRDLKPPDEVRVYALASTQHTPGALPQDDFHPSDGSRGRYGFNVVDFTPLLRAALLNLDAWVEHGIEPPPSAVPELARGTAVPRTTVLDDYTRFGHVTLPDPDRLSVLRAVDLGPDAARGVVRLPVKEGGAYPVYVSAVDSEGNEMAGIRLPDITVPLATHTGWNPRNPAVGGDDQLMLMFGFSWFFTRTMAERQELGDPRRSIEERYFSRDDFLEQVGAAAQTLIADGYVLEEDVHLLLEDALERWDYVAAGKDEGFGPVARR